MEIVKKQNVKSLDYSGAEDKCVTEKGNNANRLMDEWTEENMNIFLDSASILALSHFYLKCTSQVYSYLNLYFINLIILLIVIILSLFIIILHM